MWMGTFRRRRRRTRIDPDGRYWSRGDRSDAGRLRTSSNNGFDNAIIRNGGGADWANVYVEGGVQGSVTNSTRRQSETWIGRHLV